MFFLIVNINNKYLSIAKLLYLTILEPYTHFNVFKMLYTTAIKSWCLQHGEWVWKYLHYQKMHGSLFTVYENRMGHSSLQTIN